MLNTWATTLGTTVRSSTAFQQHVISA